MTDSIEKVLSDYQVRKNKKQKNAFLEYVRETAQKEGYSFEVSSGALGSKNLIAGDLSTAKVIFTAHYDTCVRLPFPNFLTPKNFGIYFLYQLLITAAMVFLFFGLSFLIGVAFGAMSAAFSFDSDIAATLATVTVEGIILVFLYLFLAGPANKHTANDNTSGVVTLFSIMSSLSSENRASAAFIFFDLEEMGLIGSSSVRKQYKALTDRKLLLNFDCVGDGKHFIFALKKGAVKYESLLKEAFPQEQGCKVEVLSRGVFYPSDQMSFPLGVGVASFLQTKRGMLYIDKIHTKRDTVLDRDNIAFLTDGACRLVTLL